MSSTANYIAWRERRDLEDGARAKTLAAAATEKSANTIPTQMIGKKVADLTGNKQAADDLVEDNRKLFCEVIDNAKLDEVRTSAPKLAEWLNQKQNYALAKGDLDKLLPIAKTIARIGEAPKVPPLWKAWPADNLSLPAAAASTPFDNPGANAVGPLRSAADRMGQAVEGGEEAGVLATPQTQEMPNASAAGLPAAAPVQTAPTAVPATDGAGQSAPSEAFGAREDPSAGAAGTPAGTPVQTPSAVVPETPGTQENSSTGAAGGPASVPDKAATAAPKTEEAGQTSASSISTADEAFIDAVANAKPENFAQFHNAIDLRPGIPREKFHRILDEMALGLWTPDNAKRALRSWLRSARNTPGAKVGNEPDTPPNGTDGRQSWRIDPSLSTSTDSLFTFRSPDLGKMGGQVLEAPKPTVPYFTTPIGGWLAIPTTTPPLAGLLAVDPQGMSWWERVSRSFSMANAKLIVQGNEFARDFDEAMARSAWAYKLDAWNDAFDRAVLRNDDGSPNFLGRLANWARAQEGGHQMVGGPDITPEQRADAIAHRDLGPFHRAASETLNEMAIRGFAPMSYKDVDGVGPALSFALENFASALPETLISLGSGLFSLPLKAISQGGDVNAELKERTDLPLEQRVFVAIVAGSLLTVLDQLELSRFSQFSKLNEKVGEAAKKTLGGRLVGNRAIKATGEAVQKALSESTASTLQEAIKVAVTALNGGTYNEGELVDRFLQAGFAGFASGAFLHAAGEDKVEALASEAAQRMSGAARSARAVVVSQTVLSEISGLAEAYKLRAQSPELLRSGVETTFKGSQFEKVHLSGKALADYFDSHHIDPSAFFATMEGVTRKDFDTALETGADLPIPVATYATRIAGSDADATLRSHMRFDPSQLTLAEVKTLIDSLSAAVGGMSSREGTAIGTADSTGPGANPEDKPASNPAESIGSKAASAPRTGTVIDTHGNKVAPARDAPAVPSVSVVNAPTPTLPAGEGGKTLALSTKPDTPSRELAPPTDEDRLAKSAPPSKRNRRKESVPSNISQSERMDAFARVIESRANGGESGPPPRGESSKWPARWPQ